MSLQRRGRAPAPPLSSPLHQLLEIQVGVLLAPNESLELGVQVGGGAGVLRHHGLEPRRREYGRHDGAQSTPAPVLEREKVHAQRTGPLVLR